MTRESGLLFLGHPVVSIQLIYSSVYYVSTDIHTRQRFWRALIYLRAMPPGQQSSGRAKNRQG